MYDPENKSCQDCACATCGRFQTPACFFGEACEDCDGTPFTTACPGCGAAEEGSAGE